MLVQKTQNVCLGAKASFLLCPLTYVAGERVDLLDMMCDDYCLYLSTHAAVDVRTAGLCWSKLCRSRSFVLRSIQTYWFYCFSCRRPGTSSEANRLGAWTKTCSVYATSWSFGKGAHHAWDGLKCNCWIAIAIPWLGRQHRWRMFTQTLQLTWFGFNSTGKGWHRRSHFPKASVTVQVALAG